MHIWLQRYAKLLKSAISKSMSNRIPGHMWCALRHDANIECRNLVFGNQIFEWERRNFKDNSAIQIFKFECCALTSWESTCECVAVAVGLRDNYRLSAPSICWINNNNNNPMHAKRLQFRNDSLKLPLPSTSRVSNCKWKPHHLHTRPILKYVYARATYTTPHPNVPSGHY